MGQPLFHRLAHGVRLTEHAARELPSLGEAFDALATAMDRFRTISPGARVAHRCPAPCIAQLWLTPRLARLKRDFVADVQVSISALEAPPHFRRDFYDFAIFYASVPPPGSRRHRARRRENLPGVFTSACEPWRASRAPSVILLAIRCFTTVVGEMIGGTSVVVGGRSLKSRLTADRPIRSTALPCRRPSTAVAF